MTLHDGVSADMALTCLGRLGDTDSSQAILRIHHRRIDIFVARKGHVHVKIGSLCRNFFGPMKARFQIMWSTPKTKVIQMVVP